MKKLRKTLLLSVISLMTFFAYSAIFNNNISYTLVENQFIHSVSSLDEANKLADDYNLELLEYDSYGIATYLNTENIDTLLINNGFSYNSYASVEAPPWQTSSEEDPYLRNQYALDMETVIDTWGVTEGSADITIAIIDTGIDIYHEEFTGRISSLSKNVVTGAVGLTAVIDDFGHGTMVAGIIGANKDNSVGIAGITQNTTLLVIKANQTGEGAFFDSDVIEGIYYSIDNGADVINLSLGSTYPNPNTRDAIDVAIENGIVVVGASGNDGDDTLNYPASFDQVISVGALDNTYTIAEYSNYNEQVDISAPGSDILTTSIDGGYMYGSGTSFAAPQVTGIIALYMSVYPDATVAEIKDKLFITAMDLGADSLDEYYGYGLVQAYDFVVATYYTITYVTFPGTPVEPDYVLSGTYLESTPIPTLTDSVFIGWYLDPNFINPFDDSVPITSNLTLYALYSDAYHTVRFVTDGTSVSSLVVEHLDTFTLPTTSLEGYRFLGWYTEPELINQYQMAPVIGDLTLYASFEEIIYYSVTFYVQGDVYIVESYEENTVITLPQVDIYGYNFDGWYLDSEFTQEYVNNPIAEDMILYAKLSQNTYDITLWVDGISSVVSFEYLSTPTIVDPIKVGYEFAGWYLDSELTQRYYLSPITEDFTLYAKFVSEAYTIDLIILGEHYDYVYVESGATPILPEISMLGYDFNGWFLDSGFATEYVNGPLSNNLVLYGNYSETEYVIRFFDSNGSIVTQYILYYNDLIVYPANPTKDSTLSFTYTFLNWSTTMTNATSSLDIYPIFERTFIESSVSLNPGVDTIMVGDEHIDGSITTADTSLTVVTESNLDSEEAGKYEIIYNIYDGGELLYSISRYVRVIEPETDVNITLNPGISTIYLGEEYTEEGATSNVGEIVISGTVDTANIGIYYITYTVEYNGMTYAKTRIVTVLDQSVKTVQVITALSYKEEDYE